MAILTTASQPALTSRLEPMIQHVDPPTLAAIRLPLEVCILIVQVASIQLVVRWEDLLTLLLGVAHLVVHAWLLEHLASSLVLILV